MNNTKRMFYGFQEEKEIFTEVLKNVSSTQRHDTYVHRKLQIKKHSMSDDKRDELREKRAELKCIENELKEIVKAEEGDKLNRKTQMLVKIPNKRNTYEVITPSKENLCSKCNKYATILKNNVWLCDECSK